MNVRAVLLMLGLFQAVGCIEEPGELPAHNGDERADHEKQAAPRNGLFLTVERAEIAAGGIETPPHQTRFTISVRPPQVVNVTVSMRGGDGKAFLVIPQRPARATFSMSDVLSPDEEMMLTTDREGRIEGVLTSSNESSEKCTLRAECTIRGETFSDSKTVTFVYGEQDMDIPELLIPGSNFTAKATRTFKGQPLKGHRQLFYVSSVIIDGKEISSPLPSSSMDKYATVVESPPVCETDETGTATVKVYLKEDASAESVGVTTRDITVYDSGAVKLELGNLFR